MVVARAAEAGPEQLDPRTPWIHSNLLLTSLLLDTRPQHIVLTAERTVAALDRYLDAVPDNGGCDEGINYWWRAGGSLFECLETLASACGDDYGVFEIQKIGAIARCPVITHIAGGWHVNFADGSPKPGAVPHLLYRFGRRTGPANTVYSVAFSPDGKTLAAGSADDAVRLWDVSDPAHPAPLGKPLTRGGRVRAVGRVRARRDDPGRGQRRSHSAAVGRH